MRDGRTASRIVGIVAAVVAVLSLVGVVTMVAVNAFVLDKYNAYGEVPIPGQTTVYLPAGEVAVNFHTQVIGSPTGGGLPVPRLTIDIAPPPGVPEPEVRESYGATITVNNDSHRRVWTMQVKGEGGYTVSVDGPVTGFISPRLAFGDNAGLDWPIWVFLALAVFGADLALILWWLRRRRRIAAAPPATGSGLDPSTPTDEGVRLEQLKTIAALKDSGALTEREFQEEKRRIIEGR